MPKSYTDEFKQQLIDLHIHGGRAISEISKSYGLGHTTLPRWIKQAKANNGSVKVVLSPLEEENLKLKKRLREVELEHEILKQAALILGKK